MQFHPSILIWVWSKLDCTYDDKKDGNLEVHVSIISVYNIEMYAHWVKMKFKDLTPMCPHLPRQEMQACQRGKGTTASPIHISKTLRLWSTWKGQKIKKSEKIHTTFEGLWSSCNHLWGLWSGWERREMLLPNVCMVLNLAYSWAGDRTLNWLGREPSNVLWEGWETGERWLVWGMDLLM